MFSQVVNINANRIMGICGAVGTTGGSSFAGKVIAPVAGTFSKLGLYNSDATSTSKSVRFYKNGANGNQLVSIPNSTTGWFEDASNSDTVAVSDDCEISISIGSAAWALNGCRLEFVPSSVDCASYYANNMSGSSANNPQYLRMDGTGNGASAETTGLQQRIRAPGNAKRLFASLSSNASTATTTVRFRINAANGTNLVTIAASTTGDFEDTSHSDTLATGDLVTVSYSGHNASLSLRTGIGIERTGNKFDVGVGFSASRTGSATKHFWSFGLEMSTTTSETNLQKQLTFAVKATNLRHFSNTNACNGAVTINLRKNGVDSSLSYNVPASTSGWFEDTTGSETLAAGDKFNFSAVGGTSGAMACSGVYVTLDSQVGVARSQVMIMG